LPGRDSGHCLDCVPLAHGHRLTYATKVTY
jgi:hypothetical protein